MSAAQSGVARNGNSKAYYGARHGRPQYIAIVAIGAPINMSLPNTPLDPAREAALVTGAAWKASFIRCC
jgi:hypothetical protein